MIEQDIRRPLVIAVDDEPNILSSLRRALRPVGADFACFDSPAAALAALATREPDLIISDMRMPGMEGDEFLRKARAIHPGAVRILLTGYSDYGKAMSAVNEGGIWRHLSKPWQDQQLIACVREALALRQLHHDKARLERLALAQKAELERANATLEAKVAERTAELSLASAKLEANFSTLVKVLSGIVDSRFAEKRGGRVAEIARAASVQLNLSPAECARVHRAALLRLIGKLAFPDELLSTPPSEMTREQAAAVRAYPVNGEELLMAIEDLRPEAAIIRSHCERFDGRGFPDRLAEEDIPVGSRVLAAAAAFDELLGPDPLDDRAASASAARELAKQSGAKLCPKSCQAILAAFCIAPSAEDPSAPPRPRRDEGAERAVLSPAFEPGMQLSRDARAPSGALLLAAGQRLTPAIIAQLRRFEERHGAQLRFHIALDPGEAP